MSKTKQTVPIKVGDKVESTMTEEQCRRNEARDILKAKKEGVHFFTGNAATYMHLDEAYLVERITETGGLRLRGYASTVSPNNVRVSTKPVYR